MRPTYEDVTRITVAAVRLIVSIDNDEKTWDADVFDQLCEQLAPFRAPPPRREPQ